MARLPGNGLQPVNKAKQARQRKNSFFILDYGECRDKLMSVAGEQIGWMK